MRKFFQLKSTTFFLTLLTVGCGTAEQNERYIRTTSVTYTPQGELVVLRGAELTTFGTSVREEGISVVVDDIPQGPPPQSLPYAFALSQDGQVGAITFQSTEEDEVVFFEGSTGSRITGLDIEAPAAYPVHYSVALNTNGARAFVHGKSWGMFDTQTGERLWGLEDERSSQTEFLAATFSANGEVLFGLEGNRLVAHDALDGHSLFDVATGNEMLFPGALSLTEQGNLLLGVRRTFREGEDGNAGPNGWDEGHKIWDETYVFWSTENGSVVREVPQFSGVKLSSGSSGLEVLTCSPNGELCASAVGPDAAEGYSNKAAREEDSVAVWKPDGTLLFTIQADADSLQFSPDSASLAIAGRETSVHQILDGVLVSSQTYANDRFQ